MTDRGQPRRSSRGARAASSPWATPPVCPSCGLAGPGRTRRGATAVGRRPDPRHRRRACGAPAGVRRPRRASVTSCSPPPRRDGRRRRVGDGAHPTAPRAEWRPERVRDVLLWLGALAARHRGITFAAVAWTRLGPAGRAGDPARRDGGSRRLTDVRAPSPAPHRGGPGRDHHRARARRLGRGRGTRLCAGDWSGAAWWSVGLLARRACSASRSPTASTSPSVRLGATMLATRAAVFALGAWSPERTVVVIALAASTTARGAPARRAPRAGGRWSRPCLGALDDRR